MKENTRKTNINALLERVQRLSKSRTMLVLAAIVVFVTTYALILPALTLEQDKASAEAGLDLGILEALTGGSAQETESTEPAPVDLTEQEPVDITEPPTAEPEPTPEPSPAPVQDDPTPQETAPAETVTPTPAAPVLQPLAHPRKGAAADLLAEALDQLDKVKDGTAFYYNEKEAQRTTRSNQPADGSALFVSYCLEQADISTQTVPRSRVSAAWVTLLQEKKLYTKAGTDDPAPGDLVFFINKAGKVYRMGVVTEVLAENGTPKQIEVVEYGREVVR
ncbi:MAG: hypothetical protein IKD93_04745, partial [Firmicutes bacterium]|nr:hypothetical protein [Bacillota bacterium]